jgi:hypothetical protein
MAFANAVVSQDISELASCVLLIHRAIPHLMNVLPVTSLPHACDGRANGVPAFVEEAQPAEAAKGASPSVDMGFPA